MVQFAPRAHDALIRYTCNDVVARNSSDVCLDEIGDRIAELAAHLDAATYRLLVLLYEFDEGYGWHGGFRTCAHWLSWRTGMDLGAAREKVRVARALHDLPLLSEAMRRGVLSYSKARAVTRVATSATESDLLDLAMHGTAAHIERIVRAWRTVDRNEEAWQEQERHERRGLSISVDDDGSYVLRGRLDPEVGAVLERALEMAREELCGRRAGGSYMQELADAIGLVAELALQRDGAGEPESQSGTRADRFQVMLHVDGVALQAGVGMCELANGVRVSAETSRRLSCDASQVTMTHGASGAILDVGRRTRTIAPALRRALDYRDRGCRFPGCGLRFCDAHHVTHWADGGPTSLDNLVLLCRFHHRMLHEEGYSMSLDAARDVVFRGPHGNQIRDVPVPREVRGDVVQVLRDEHWDDGLDIDGNTAPLWSGGHLDLHLATLMMMPDDDT